jgi:putative ABC transport system permease protein
MRWFYKLPLRFRSLFRKSRVEKELTEELRFHLEKLYEGNVAKGMTPEEGRYAALRELGGVEQIKEECRDMRRVNYIENFFQDLRYSLRMLAKNPGFTAVAVLTLALGIGANTAIFSVVNTVLLRPLPFRAPSRLVSIAIADTKTGASGGVVSYPDFLDWRAQNHVLERMAAYRTSMFALTGTGEATYVLGGVVSADLFPLLGVEPILGRTFLPQEDQPGGTSGSPPVILSHQFWQQRFNADPNVLGRTIELDNKSFVVVGVMPKGFQFPMQAEPLRMWTTIAIDAEAPEGGQPNTVLRGDRYLQAIARLKPDISLAQAGAEMNTIASQLATQYPDTNTNVGIGLVPFATELVTDIRTPLLILVGAVGFVLLIACVNVANLLLARATSREREIAIRVALGAGPMRLIRQLLTESMLVALIGGAVGLLWSFWGTGFLVKLCPKDIPRLAEVSIDVRVLGFTLFLSLVTGILFGLVPAVRVSKTSLGEALKEGCGTFIRGVRYTRSRSALLVGEVALSLVLLIGAGLLVESLVRLVRVNPGFYSNHVLTATLALPGARYNSEQQVDFFEDLATRVGVLPGVRVVSAVAPLPFSGSSWDIGVEVEAHPVPQGEMPYVGFHIVCPGYFKAMQIPLIRGRDFTTHDNLDAPLVVIVNRRFVQRFFPHEDPIGQRIQPMRSLGKGAPPMREIIAVVGDVKSRDLRAEPEPEIHLPLAQAPMLFMTLVIQTEGDPVRAISGVRNAIGEMDKDLPIYELKTLNEYLGLSLATLRFNTLLLGVFAGLALILTGVGLYGVISYTVTQRTHEIGIRMALGAKRGDVLKLVVGQGMAAALIGIGVGLFATLGLTRFLSSMLYGVRPTDPLTILAGALALAAVSLLASYIPARRATKVDPMVALRYE